MAHIGKLISWGGRLGTLAAIAFLISSKAYSAERVQYLRHPQEALAAFETLPAEAKKSIDLATFIFEPCDASTRILMDTLAAKAKQGIRVRILLDSILQSAGRKAELAGYFADAGIQLRFYNEREPNSRMHAKLLVVDGASYIAGGRNISDEYFGLSGKVNFTDRDLLVRGPSSKQAALAFEELWNAPAVSGARPGGARFAGWNAACPAGSLARAGKVRAYLAAHGAGILEQLPARSCPEVHVYSDHPDFSDSKYSDHAHPDIDGYINPARLARKRATKFLLHFIYEARASLRMENWVYIPIGYLRDIIGHTRARRVPIQVLTNQDMDGSLAVYRQAMVYSIRQASERDSVGTQSVALVSSGGANQVGFALTPRGARNILHGKVATRDGRDVAVGSFNLDPRSFGINLELNVSVPGCPSLAGDVESGMDQLQRAHEQDLRTGRASPPEQISPAAIALAAVGIQLF
jgi:phosphatidylserine/phosphatidylglycerophosphate/cardiolipin synthase-like enzyme